MPPGGTPVKPLTCERRDFLTSNSLYTLPLALLNMEYSSVGQVNFGYLEAGAMIPCVVLYIALQRYYIRGLTSGVVKGWRP